MLIYLFTYFFQPSIKSKGASIKKTETVSSGWGDDDGGWGATDDWGSPSEPEASSSGANNDWGMTSDATGDNWGDSWGAADSASTQPTKTSKYLHHMMFDSVCLHVELL